MTRPFYLKDIKTTNVGWIKPKEYKDMERTRPDLYKTQRWKKNRLLFLKSNPLCVRCKMFGITTAATLIDHITPIADVPEDKQEEMFFNQDNWQPLCFKCHTVKTNKDLARRRK